MDVNTGSQALYNTNEFAWLGKERSERKEWPLKYRLRPEWIYWSHFQTDLDIERDSLNLARGQMIKKVR